MPDVVADPAAWRQAALDGLGRYLCDQHGATPLSPFELTRYRDRGATHGWRLPDPKSGPAALDMLIDGDFPYSAARVALPEGPGPLEWPHVESDGALCVLPGQATISARDPAAVAKCVLDDALALIADCRDGFISDDFRDEFLSYWIIATDEDARPFVSLIAPNGPSREVLVWRGETVCICADDRATLDGWLTRWGAKKPKRGFTFSRALLIWLPRPMVPAEYPRTASDVRSLVGNCEPDAVALLEECTAADPKSFDVIVGAPTTHGACFAAVTLRRPDDKEIVRGFRPGRVPKAVLIDRYLGANKITRNNVHRADHGWVHGRDQDSRQTNLKEARVLVLGCGAIGSGVARLLAQSGVGNLTLVDHQLLDWPNVSRHILGARAVHKNKAKAMAEVLRHDFPHLAGIEGRRVKFGLTATSLIDELPTFDLVIAATGEWGVDVLFNDLHQSCPGVPPVIYAWLEAQATAAHGLFIPQAADCACLRCGFDDLGVPSLSVTSWPDGRPMLQEPACGAVFSPFGAVELLWAHALIAEFVLDALTQRIVSSICRTWIGRRETVENAGGRWNPAWCDLIGNPGQGGVVVRRDWPRSSDCPVCNRVVAA